MKSIPNCLWTEKMCKLVLALNLIVQRVMPITGDVSCVAEPSYSEL